VKRIDLRNRRTVLLGLLVAALVIFAAGMGAAWHVRNRTVCQDGKPPVAQRSGALLPTEYKCHDGQVVTASQG
jgi:hypothetical protein